MEVSLNKTHLRFASIACLLAGLGALFYFFPPPPSDCVQLQGWILAWGFWGPVYFCGLYALATLGLFPGVLLSLLAGLAYGPAWGTLLVTMGATLGSSAVFLLSRFLLRDRIETMMQRQNWFQKFRRQIAANPFASIIFVRLVPLFPFSGINLASGVLPIGLWQFFLGSLVGMIPGSFAYVYLGQAGCQLIEPLLRGEWSIGAIPSEQLYGFAAGIVLLALLALLPILVNLRKSKAPGASQDLD